MNDHVIEEMADAISTELHIPNEDVLRILHHYWQDKIAPLWQVADLLETALNAGVPITKEDAIDYGLSGPNLRAWLDPALQDRGAVVQARRALAAGHVRGDPDGCRQRRPRGLGAEE